MSFSSQLKIELCTLWPSGVQKLAECYGLLMFARGFSFDNISILTENEEVSARYASFLRTIFDVSARVAQSGTRKDLNTVKVTGAADRAKIMHFFGYVKSGDSFIINKKYVDTTARISDFLRGAFLACGSITNPEKEYHLEFVLSSETQAKEIAELIKTANLKPRVTKRGNCHVVYFKESGQIEDILTFMGATTATLDIIDVKIYKDFRNLANRRANAEIANITKTVSAAAPQIEAAKKLRDKGVLTELSTELAEAVMLRLDNPELSLRDLAALTSDHVSRSGINHRLAKIMKIAEEL